MAHPTPYIGIAGWSLRREFKEFFPELGTHLQRYAQRFSCVEINSSFYRPHRPQTYRRWAAEVPEDFRFSVKMPRTITHQHRLEAIDELWAQFHGEVQELEKKLGAILVQLPPSLGFMELEARTFFKSLRKRYAGTLVFEPRHRQWFTNEADHLLREFRIHRVAASPAIDNAPLQPGGDLTKTYYRLHGTPVMYYSTYTDAFLQDLGAEMAAGEAEECWCIFDNTAAGEAWRNAFTLQSLFQGRNASIDSQDNSPAAVFIPRGRVKTQIPHAAAPASRQGAACGHGTPS